MITSLEMSSQQSVEESETKITSPAPFAAEIYNSTPGRQCHLAWNTMRGQVFWTQGVWLYGSEELRGFESMEQLLLSGKDWWRVPSLAGAECGGGRLWMAGTQDGSAHCPPQPAFVTAAQHQTRSRQPLLYSRHSNRLHSRQLAHVTPLLLFVNETLLGNSIRFWPFAPRLSWQPI